jgi:hypothetical protein
VRILKNEPQGTYLEGTATELLKSLTRLKPKGVWGWPKAANAFSTFLHRFMPLLHKAGIRVDFDRAPVRNRDRMIRIWLESTQHHDHLPESQQTANRLSAGESIDKDLAGKIISEMRVSWNDIPDPVWSLLKSPGSDD